MCLLSHQKKKILGSGDLWGLSEAWSSELSCVLSE